jgi:hypothetical protein
MENGVLMRVLDRLRNNLQIPRGLVRREGLLAHPFCEALPFDIIHRKVRLPLVFARLVDRYNIGVLQTGGG